MEIIESLIEVGKMTFGIILGMYIVEKWFLKRQINGVIKQITAMKEFKEINEKIKQIDTKKINEIIENLHKLLVKNNTKAINTQEKKE